MSLESLLAHVGVNGRIHIDKACKNCGRLDSSRPAIFKGLPYCSDKCRKKLMNTND